MNSQRDEHGGTAFEQQARAAFDDSVSHLDGATLSRLNQSRQRALDAARGRASSTRGWMRRAPVGAVAAAALIAVVMWRAPATPDAAMPVAANTTASPVAEAQLDPMTVLAAGDDLELAAEADDLDFYAWVELETIEDGVT